MSVFDGVDYLPYSLADGNPYVHRELDARRPEDRRLLLDFAGFPQLGDIDEHIDNSISGRRSAAFLLSGREGTGRTTLAKTIMHRYVERRSVGETSLAETFHVVKFNEVNHDSRDRTYNIIKTIRNAIFRNGNWDEHRMHLIGAVPDGDGHGLGDADLQGRAEYLGFYAENRITPPMHIGLLIDGVQEAAFMDTLATVFENIPVVIAVTWDHYDNADTASAQRLDERDQWQKWAQHITLPPLTGDGVQWLACNRWEATAPQVDCPFDLDGLRNTFDNRQEPIARALEWLRWLLHWRLTKYEGTDRWPAAQELGLSAKWIEAMVGIVETAP